MPVATGARRTASSYSTLPTLKSTSTSRRKNRPSVRHLERLEAALAAWTGEERAPTAETLAYSAGVPARICEVLLSDLEEAGSVERDQDGSIAIVVPPETFKAGVRDLVAKLKTFLRGRTASSPDCRLCQLRGVPQRIPPAVFRGAVSTALRDVRPLSR